LSCMSFLSIFEINSFSVSSFAIIFYHSEGCLFTLLIVFPAPLVKEIVFSPLYILASFVKGKVSIGVWVYLKVFYFVPLISISVFVPVPYCLWQMNG